MHVRGAAGRILGLLVLSSALALGGCPPPAQPGGDVAQSGGEGSGPAEGGDRRAGGGAGGGADGGADSGDGADGTPWEVIGAEVLKKDLYPMLQPLATWPNPASLRPIAEAPAEARPDATQVRLLEELVSYIVREDLRPRDVKAALGLDSEGRLHMRLGRGKTEGSASLELGSDDPQRLPVFAMTVADTREGPHDLTRLRERVAQVVVPALAAELKQERNAIEAHPQVRGSLTAGMALLDRAGFGAQFPYLYAYATDTHLVVLLQEVPHQTLDRDD